MGARLAMHDEIGEYRIAGCLGSGGMGDVYRGVHRRLGIEVAIKVTAAGEDGVTAARFENEARIQASLSHPNIAAMRAYFEDAGRRCLVMEFVPGETLAARLAREGALAPAAALAILRDVARAAAFMHGRGIVHRDLTASNIRITPDGGVKLLDFGIAKLEHRRGLTAEGQVIGTAAYLAPEQLRSGQATPQSDVWSLGVLLFEMIAGRRPFEGAVPSAVWPAIEKGRPPLPNISALASSNDCARVEMVLERCLSVDPDRRYLDAGGIVTALDGAPPRKIGLRHHARPLIAAGVLLLGGIAISATWTNRVCCASDQPRSVHRIDVSQGVADVLINGRRVGRTPFDYRAWHNETIALELRQHGYVPVRTRFVVTERPVWTFGMRRP